MSNILHIEFTRPDRKFIPYSDTIRLFQGTPYSHVRFLWETSFGTTVVYEASGSTVRFLGPIAQEQNKVIVVSRFSFSLTAEQKRKLVALCINYSGVKYGLLQAFGVGLASLLRLKKNPFGTGKGTQICSELCLRIFEELFEVSLGLDPEKAGPKELHKDLIKRYKEGDTHVI